MTRFESKMDPTRRARLESLLLAVDHPQLWSDSDLERMFANRLNEINRPTPFPRGLPEWALETLAVERMLEQERI